MAQTAEEALVVRMEATLTRFERQMQRAKQVAEGTSIGMERRFSQSNAKISATSERAARSVSRFGDPAMVAQIQNASFQIGDFAVQVASGTDASRALAQQLPQLLGGMGAIGAVAGAAAAILVPFAGNLFGAAEKAKELSDVLSETDAVISAFRNAAETASLSAAGLQEKFGSASPVLRQALADLAAIEKIKAFESLDQVSSSLRGIVLEATIFSDASNNTLAQAFLGFTRNSQQARDEAQRFLVLLSQLASADPELRLDAAVMLRAQLDGAVGGYKDMNAEQREVYDGLTRIIVQLETLGVKASDDAMAVARIGDAANGVLPALDALVGKAGALADRAWDAARGIAEFARKQAEAASDAVMAPVLPPSVPSGLGELGLPFGFNPLDPGAAPRTTVRPRARPDGIDFGFPDRGRSGGGGGGGGGGGRDPVEEATEKYQRLIATLDPLARAEQQFAEAQATVNDALAKGVITSEEAARATALMGEEYAEAIAKANDAGDGFAKINDQLKDSILDLAADGVNSFDQLASAIKRAAFEALLFGSGPMAGLFGGGGSGLLGGLFGGAAGSVASAPIAAAPKLAPTVAALASSRSGAAQISVNVSGARGNSEIEAMVAQGVRSGIAQYDRQALPTRIRQISADGRRIG